MIDKYKPLADNIFMYINNRLTICNDTKLIANEVCNEFPTHVIFSNVNKDMQIELVIQLVDAVYYTRQLYKTNNNKEK